MDPQVKTFQCEIKALSEEGTFEGYASTFGGPPDSYGDVIVEGAFTETLEKGGRNGTGIPMLWQHNFKEPIGDYPELVQNKKGLKVIGAFALEVQRGNEAYVLTKKKIINALSIGWDYIRNKKGEPEEDSYEINKGIRYLKRIELWEISPVTFPANVRANINKVKGIRNASNERELEKALRESGLSRSESKYIISLIDKKSLREAEEQSAELRELLNILKNQNSTLTKEYISSTFKNYYS